MRRKGPRKTEPALLPATLLRESVVSIYVANPSRRQMHNHRDREPLFHLFEEARRKTAVALGVDLDDDDILF